MTPDPEHKPDDLKDKDFPASMSEEFRQMLEIIEKSRDQLNDSGKKLGQLLDTLNKGREGK